ncbi:diacylglycerol/lipid kinase family protein [Dactylosporangium darangshiense]|uniref:DAGKc domain-containing protein n=1 Tax=Dactylosporangium darangshiense TaxID=579108 RepID=A0ABP8D762_9ACTN
MRHSRPAGGKAARWLARAALCGAVAAVALFVYVARLRGILLIAAGAGGAAAFLAGSWWALTQRGARRAAAVALAVAAPLLVLVLFARAELLGPAIACCALAFAAVLAGRAALRMAAGRGRERPAEAPRHAVMIMNPRSGGGKVGRFGLAERARELGADVVLLDRDGGDAVALAGQAVDGGADLLGVAAGDGTVGAVAQVAIERDVPLLVLAAGTRNHFAMDLGLDRDDPAQGLDALTDGTEIDVDVGLAGDRVFVNTAAFGSYAGVVQRPGYRDAKTATALASLPDLLAGDERAVLQLSAGDRGVADPQAVLVSNNPYATMPAPPGTRARLDAGVLGVLAVAVTGASGAVRLLRGPRSGELTRLAVTEAVVDADRPSVPVGLDGEAIRLPTPVRCSVRPGALRVRVPRNRPRPTADGGWRRLLALARP